MTPDAKPHHQCRNDSEPQAILHVACQFKNETENENKNT